MMIPRVVVDLLILATVTILAATCVATIVTTAGTAGVPSPYFPPSLSGPSNIDDVVHLNNASNASIEVSGRNITLRKGKEMDVIYLNTSNTSRVEVRGLNTLPTLTDEDKQRILKVASRSEEFKHLLDEGYAVRDILPIVRGKIDLEDHIAIFESPTLVGGIVRLEKGDSIVYVSVYLDTGHVLVGPPSQRT